MAGSSMYDQYEGAARDAASTYGIPWDIFKAQITQESGWNPYAVGTSGEYGLGQLKQDAANEVNSNRYDPVSNLRGAAAYLSKQFKATGNWYDALRSYNAGAGGAAKSPANGAAYAEKILKAANYSADGKPVAGTGAANDPTLTDFEKSIAVDPSTIIQESFKKAWDAAKYVLGYSPPAALVASMATGDSIPWTNSEWFFQAIIYLVGAAIIVSLIWSSVSSIFNMRPAAQ
jgi:hypothetical protein